MKVQALKTAQEAYSLQQAKLNLFSGSPGKGGPGSGGVKEAKEHPQPRCFNGVLKSYQLNGMNWLANLYYFVSVAQSLFVFWFFIYFYFLFFIYIFLKVFYLFITCFFMFFVCVFLVLLIYSFIYQFIQFFIPLFIY